MKIEYLNSTFELKVSEITELGIKGFLNKKDISKIKALIENVEDELNYNSQFVICGKSNKTNKKGKGRKQTWFPV